MTVVSVGESPGDTVAVRWFGQGTLHGAASFNPDALKEAGPPVVRGLSSAEVALLERLMNAKTRFWQPVDRSPTFIE
jgi:hypothetical protein